MNKSLESEIRKAKKLLKNNGYQTYSLWHIDDVKDDDGILSDKDKMEILEDALTDEWVIAQVFATMDEIRDYHIEHIKNDNN